MRKRIWIMAVLAAAISFCAALTAHAQEQKFTVFAAASLRDALDAVNAAWAEAGRAPATVSYAGSSTLARQIEQGAPADLFISANVAWMDHLAEAGLIRDDTRFDLLRNRIVLAAPVASDGDIEIAPGFALAALLGDGRLAMANTDAVPAGIYGKAALQALGVWEEVRPHVAQADNVRAALKLVSSGEAPLGIVYATDAAADDGVRVVDTFPEESHPPIVYPAAAVAASNNGQALAFLAFLRTTDARAAFEAHGFAVIVEPALN